MKADWSIIPDINDIERFVKLSKEYEAAFEYNDFFWPNVYENEEEYERRIRMYESLDRDRKNDTVHGVFYDIAMISMDSVIRDRSRTLVKRSLDVARRLSCKGVVFHTGLISGLDTKAYIDQWLEGMSEYLHEIAPAYEDVQIYMENTFERTPEPFVGLMERTRDLENVSVCFDYAHAMLTVTDSKIWFEKLKPYIKHMHINDHDLKADLHLAVGDGDIDYRVFKGLVDSCQKGVRILHEVNGYEKTRRSLEYMEQL